LLYAYIDVIGHYWWVFLYEIYLGFLSVNMMVFQLVGRYRWEFEWEERGLGE
jgi:hypothetical protein